MAVCRYFFLSREITLYTRKLGQPGCTDLMDFSPSILFSAADDYYFNVFYRYHIIKKMADATNDHDPSEVVIDEATGMGITLFMLPHSITIYTMAFILFRIFDIFKPSFIYRVQNLPGGWGIMLDDVLAGIFCWLICRGLLTVL